MVHPSKQSQLIRAHGVRKTPHLLREVPPLSLLELGPPKHIRLEHL
jgi:hypothetical protein